MYTQTIHEKGAAGDYAIEKIQQVIEKYTAHPIGVKVKFDRCRHMEQVTVRVEAGPLFSVVASDSKENLYKAIECVAEKIERQMMKRKNKTKNRTPCKKLHLYEDLEQENQYENENELQEEYYVN
jgi:ribosomal subunit interface protein